MGEAMAKENGMKFFETSAKSGLNINEAFEFIARDIIKNLQEKQGKRETGTIKLPDRINMNGQDDKENQQRLSSTSYKKKKRKWCKLMWIKYLCTIRYNNLNSI